MGHCAVRTKPLSLKVGAPVTVSEQYEENTGRSLAKQQQACDAAVPNGLIEVRQKKFKEHRIDIAQIEDELKLFAHETLSGLCNGPRHNKHLVREVYYDVKVSNTLMKNIKQLKKLLQRGPLIETKSKRAGWREATCAIQ